MSDRSFAQQQVDSAQAAIDVHSEGLALEAGSDPATDLFHLILSLLGWSDARGVDFDAAVSNARQHLREEAGE